MIRVLHAPREVEVTKVSELLLPGPPPLRHLRFVVGAERAAYWIPIGPDEGCRTEDQAEQHALRLYLQDHVSETSHGEPVHIEF